MLQEQMTELVQHICSVPATVDLLGWTDSQGMTPLGQAVGWNYQEIVRLMLDALR